MACCHETQGRCTRPSKGNADKGGCRGACACASSLPCRAAPGLALPPRDYSNEAARVTFFSGLGTAFYEQTRIRLNLRRLYRSGGGAARELQRLAAALRAAAAAVAAAPPTPAGPPEPAVLQRQLDVRLAAARQQAAQLEAVVAAAGQEVAVLEGGRARLGAPAAYPGKRAWPCASLGRPMPAHCFTAAHVVSYQRTGLASPAPARQLHTQLLQPPAHAWIHVSRELHAPKPCTLRPALLLACKCRPGGEAAVRARQAGAPTGLPAGGRVAVARQEVGSLLGHPAWG